MMTEQLILRNFGSLNEVVIEDIRPYTFFIGPSGSGKSTILKMVAFLRWIYKMMCIRSYLNYSGIKVSPFSLNFKRHLKTLGMYDYLKSDTYIEYHYGSFELIYDKKLRLSQKNVLREELSLEKISFISDKRSLIGDILENNVSLKKRSFYMNETLDDYLLATEAIRNYDMPSLGIQLKVKKTSNGEKHLIEPLDNKGYSIHLNEASSGTQSSIPLSLIVEYFTKKYDIVSSLNDSVFRYASKSDSLKDFRATSNVGELPNKRVSIFLEEPEVSLYPATQRSLMNVIVSNCNATHNYMMNLMIATHSPYIINHLNLLMKAYDKDVKVEGASLNYDEVAVYVVNEGRIRDIKVQNAHLINTDLLSDDIDRIYDEYDQLDRM